VTNWLDKSGKLLAPAAAVEAAIANSQEALTRLVNGWYLKYLGRAAGNGEGQGWVNMLVAQVSEEAVLATFLSGVEFQQRANALVGGSDPGANYVGALYMLLLGRTASAGEVAGWEVRLPSYGAAGVAFNFLISVEFRDIAVTGYYNTLLHRQPPASDVAGWANSSIPLLGIRDLFEDGVEFYMNG